MAFEEKLFVREGEAWTERTPRPGLPERLSRDLGTTVVRWSIVTAVDQIWIVAYKNGALVRELRYAAGDGWTKRGTPLPFENTRELGKWLRKRNLLASPDGYDVLDAFLGQQPPPAVVEPGANYVTSFSPAHAAELHAIADRADVSVSLIVETGWHVGKRAVYDRLMARANKLGLDLTMLVDDTSPPSPLDPLPTFVHEPIAVQPIDFTGDKWTAVDYDLALSQRMLVELDHMHIMFDVPKYDLLFEAYVSGRSRLV
jgi:hypothetical protein